MGQLSDEMDSKMDRLEFGPFRDELERQLRALAGKLSKLHTDGMQRLSDDEAAGIRKQLLQRFHCISCDKPVDMASHKSVDSCVRSPPPPPLRCNAGSAVWYASLAFCWHALILNMVTCIGLGYSIGRLCYLSVIHRFFVYGCSIYS